MAFDFNQANYPHSINIIEKYCIASGRNNKGHLILDFLKQNNFTEVAFIDDKISYVQEVSDSIEKNRTLHLLAVQQAIPSSEAFQENINQNTALRKEIHSAMIKAVSEYPVESASFNNASATSRAQSLFGLQLFGGFVAPSRSEDACMQAGKETIIAHANNTLAIPQLLGHPPTFFHPPSSKASATLASNLAIQVEPASLADIMEIDETPIAQAPTA